MPDRLDKMRVRPFLGVFARLPLVVVALLLPACGFQPQPAPAERATSAPAPPTSAPALTPASPLPTFAPALPTPAPATPTPCPDRAGTLQRAEVPSAVYGAPVPLSVYLPPCYATTRDTLPVVYLLHGGNADETQWPDVGIPAASDALIARGGRLFVVVMPGGDYGTGIDYAAFVLRDLLPGVERQFRVSALPSERAIGGISLGGYWALKIAFQHPELFAAVGGHSPVVDRGHADDPLALARTAPGIDQLRVWLDVGESDALRANTERLARALDGRARAVGYAAHPGQHDRAYWRGQTPAYLEFSLGALAGGM